jgi:Uma2 family endonuclease
MVATAIKEPKIGHKNGQNGLPKKISWEQFQKQYLSREDGFKYEWLNGIIEKTPRTMFQHQLVIVDNLMEMFDLLKLQNKVTGRLMTEIDSLFDDNHRRPDIAYYTTEQIKKTRTKENQVPSFIVEIISTTDNINRVNRKVDDYFDAGVKVLWHIYPDLKKVDVYESNRHILICKNTDLCSAEAAIDGFVMTVNQIFENA